MLKYPQWLESNTNGCLGENPYTSFIKCLLVPSTDSLNHFPLKMTHKHVFKGLINRRAGEVMEGWEAGAQGEEQHLSGSSGGSCFPSARPEAASLALCWE